MHTPIRITLAVNGRFHAFDFAKCLHEVNALYQLITTYPAWYAKKWGIPTALTSQVLRVELFRRAQAMLSRHLPLGEGEYFFNTWFDDLTEKRLKEGPDFFLGWSGGCLKSLHRADSLGMNTVVERHSAHIEVQEKLLTEEYDKFGFRFTKIDSRLVDREIQEYESADFISVPSRFAKASFITKGIKAEKILHCPLAVNTELFIPAGHRARNISILYAGAVSIDKGVPHLLDAIRNLKSADLQCIVIGNMSHEFKELRSRWQDLRIKYLPYIKGPAFIQALQQASLVCLPSIQDGFNQVAIQAMACGTPILCTYNTGCEELISNGREGFVVPAGSSVALQEKLEWVLKNPDALVEMGKAARKKVENGFSWQEYANRRIQVMQNLLAEKSKAS